MIEKPLFGDHRSVASKHSLSRLETEEKNGLQPNTFLPEPTNEVGSKSKTGNDFILTRPVSVGDVVCWKDPFVRRRLMCCNDVESNPGPLTGAANDDNSSTGSSKSNKAPTSQYSICDEEHWQEHWQSLSP